MRRVPLLSGSRVVLVPLAGRDEAVLPPPPPEQLVDVRAAVRDALRFPLSGPPLEELAPRGGRATVVVEPPALPLPRAPHDPRLDALAAALGELERCGVPPERHTILVAGGLGRRLGRGELEQPLLPPAEARAFRGRVLVHDAEDEALVPLDGARIHPALLESDVSLVLTAAESALHGGPAALAAAPDAATARSLAG
ncbi:MAG TPA: lactate racemase domain-containing protein, partial [Gaiellaceae bacterium]|nr:lactate racemase domain-containing protein [Gaiellaceae bacterium]